MSYRFTNTEKWQDSWFTSLKQIEMLLFIYLCDNCDIAGFMEVNLKRWSADLNSVPDTLKGALKGLQRGLIISEDGSCLFIKNFLRHQKNYPLNGNNKAHIGILRRFDIYSEKFNIQDVNEFIKGGSKGLQGPSGNGNGIGNGLLEEIKVITWRENFEIYLSEMNAEFERLTNDPKFIKDQEEVNPNVDIILSIKKSIMKFWGEPKGWAHKKGSKTKIIDWRETFINAIDMNKVYKQRQNEYKQPEYLIPNYSD